MVQNYKNRPSNTRVIVENKVAHFFLAQGVVYNSVQYDVDWILLTTLLCHRCRRQNTIIILRLG